MPKIPITDFSRYPRKGLLELDKRTGEDAYKFCHARIAGAMRFREDSNRNWSGPKDWDKDYMQYRGIDTLLPGEDIVVVNETGAAVETYLAFLIYNQPKWKPQPRHYEDVISTAIQGFLVNYDWREYSFQTQFKRAGKDAAITGKGFIRIGWSQPEEHESKNFLKYGRIGTRDYVRPNGPWGRRVSPYDMLIDPEAPEYDLASSRWCGELYWLPVRDILYSADPTLSKEVVAKIRSGEGRGAFADAYHINPKNRGVKDPSEYDKDKDRVMVCEFWDKVYLQWYQFVPGIIEPLREGPWPYLGEDGKPYLDGFPYVEIPFFEIPDCIYGVGIPRWIRPQQHELNRIRTQMFNYHQRLTTIMFTVISNAFADKKELLKLKEGEMGEYLLARAHDAVQAIAIPALPTDIYQIEAKIMQDIERTLGLDELVRSGRLPSRTSAREINARTDLLTLKTRPRKANFDEAAMSVARQILQHEKRWATDKRVLRVAGPIGRYWQQIKDQTKSQIPEVAEAANDIYSAMQSNFVDRYGQTFVQFSSEDIQAEYDMDMVSMAMGDYDPDMRRAALEKLYGMTLNGLPIMGQQGYVPDMGEFLEKLFEAWDITDAPAMIPWVKTPDTPEQYDPNSPPQMGNQPAQPTAPQPPNAQQGMEPGSNFLAGLLGGGQQ